VNWPETISVSGSLSSAIWTAVVVGAFALARSIVLARADQKRAANEGTAADSKASHAQFERLEREIERLTARVLTLELAGVVKDGTIAELTAKKLEMLAERAAERVLNAAALAERDATIAHLRMTMSADPYLVAEKAVTEGGKL
jgi:hypothetical protein